MRQAGIIPMVFRGPAWQIAFMKNFDSRYGDSGESQTTFPQVTPCMVRSRTVELAILAGRNSFEIRQRDYEQAKRELTGETNSDRQQAVLYPGLLQHAV